MATTLRQLAELVQGRIVGEGNTPIHGARPLGEAKVGDITYVEDRKHIGMLNACTASAVVVPAHLTATGIPVLVVPDPLQAFVAIVRHLHGRAELPVSGLDPRASIHPSACIGKDTSVLPFACIGEGSSLGSRCRIHSGVSIGRNCKIGDDVVIYPNAVLYDGTTVGSRTIIHANAVLGADGFGYRFREGKHAKVPQQGSVEIGDDVEIGACTTIDRATFSATRIGSGTKIDNLVQVGHNCQVGQHNLIVSQVGVAGSCTTGDYVIIAGQVGIADHIHIGDRVTIGAKAGVTRDISAGERILGAPATPEREQKRIMMSLEKLPDMRKDLHKIKHMLGIQDDAA